MQMFWYQNSRAWPLGVLSHTLVNYLLICFLHLAALTRLVPVKFVLFAAGLQNTVLQFNIQQEEHLVRMAQTIRPISYLTFPINICLTLEPAISTTTEYCILTALTVLIIILPIHWCKCHFTNGILLLYCLTLNHRNAVFVIVTQTSRQPQSFPNQQLLISKTAYNVIATYINI